MMTTTIASSLHAHERHQSAFRWLILAGALLLAFSVSACGGGGGGGGSRDAAASGFLGSGDDPGGGGGNPGGNVGGGGAGGEAAFEATVYPLVRQYCVTCHAGAGPGFPHIAHPDVGTAYRAVVDNQKVDLLDPPGSQLAQKLLEPHNCWSNCADDSMTMAMAIQSWADMVGLGNLDPNDPNAMVIPPPDGIFSSSASFASATLVAANRVNNGIVARYEFDETQGETAFDTSGMGPAMHLDLEGDYEWLSGGGVNFMGGRGITSAANSIKLWNAIASGSGSQQYTVEAWVVPANTTQEGPARIVSYSDGTQRRNFTLGQQQYSYVFRNRSMAPDVNDNGGPDLVTNDADEDLQATLQHVVMTFDQTDGRKIYVNGMFTDDDDPQGPGLLVNWDPDHRFVVANETSNNRTWLGQIRFVAVFERALTPAEILTNYLAGAVDRFMLRFPLDAWLGAGSYIDFEVAEFDDYSYVFCYPTIGGANQMDFPVQGIRIAVNNVTPVASQSFATVDTMVDANPDRISELCSVVPKDLGIQFEDFAISFEVLAGNQDIVVENPAAPAPVLLDPTPRPDIGIRDFDQVVLTMAELTGVSPTNSNVQMAFDELTQQLPANADIRSFVSAQEVAISKLSLEFCDVLVETPALRPAVFGAGFNFNAAVPTAFGPAQNDALILALTNRMIGTGLANQPTVQEVTPILSGLITTLTTGCDAATCPAERTRTVAKGLCAAVLSSAAVHID